MMGISRIESKCLNYLADKDNEVKFSVLHVKNSHGLIEPSADHSGSHVKWTVSSLSPVGPIAQTSKSAEHHGVVQVFKEVGHENSFSFRVYLAGNNCSDIKVRKLKGFCFHRNRSNGFYRTWLTGRIFGNPAM